MPQRNQRNTVFISYSHVDKAWLGLLRRHLKHLERDHAIKVWHDEKIKLGTKWRNEIKSALKSAKIAICLVSADFIASDFIIKDELPPMLEAAKKDGAKIIPLIISPCEFEDSALSQFQSVNDPTKPLTAISKNDQELLFLKLSRAIKEEFRKEKSNDKRASIEKTKPSEPDESIEEAKIFSEFRKEFKEALRRSFTFLLVGRTGVGKSSTINSLLGKKICKVGRHRTTTSEVKSHRSKIEGIHFSVVDTPGLGDGDYSDDQGEKEDRNYLGKIKSRIRRIDSMMFVTKLDDGRVRRDEKSTIRLISEVFGNEIWDRTVIVFSHADKVSSKRYLKDLAERTKLIREEIAKHTKWTKARLIPAVAVANDDETHKPVRTPDGNQWLGELFTQVFLRVSKEGAIPFYWATRKRIKVKKKHIPKNKKTLKKSRFSYFPSVTKNTKQLLKPLIEKVNSTKNLSQESDTTFDDRINSIFAQPTQVPTEKNKDSINSQSAIAQTGLQKTKYFKKKSKQFESDFSSTTEINDFENPEEVDELTILLDEKQEEKVVEAIEKSPELSALAKIGSWAKDKWEKGKSFVRRLFGR